LKLVVGELYILAFRHLKAAHQLLTVDNDVTNRAMILIVHAGAALFVEEMKRNALIFCRAMKADGDRH
jgi:hypothetical protein